LLSRTHVGYCGCERRPYMWLFTRYGMYSAVSARTGDGKKGNPPDPTRMMVRARDRDHLQNLVEMFPEEFQGVEIEESVTNDYRFRVFVAKDVWVQVVAALVMDVDYDNFKDSLDHTLPHEQAGPYHRSCMSVWSAMYRHQTDKYGWGIYDKPLPPKKKGKGKKAATESYSLLSDTEQSPFSEVRLEPKGDDDEVILVRNNDTGDVVGAIAFAQDIKDDAQAYDDSVVDGTLVRVSNPRFERVSWGEVKHLAIPVW